MRLMLIAQVYCVERWMGKISVTYSRRVGRSSHSPRKVVKLIQSHDLHQKWGRSLKNKTLKVSLYPRYPHKKRLSFARNAILPTKWYCTKWYALAVILSDKPTSYRFPETVKSCVVTADPVCARAHSSAGLFMCLINIRTDGRSGQSIIFTSSQSLFGQSAIRISRIGG